MNPHLQDRSVLVLNRHWLAVDSITVAEAFAHLAAGTARALDIDGRETIRPLEWEAWRLLPVRPGDRGIGTPRGVARVPAVVLLARYDRVPLCAPRFGLRGLWQRDGGRCQYTGRKLSPGEGDIDHVLPRSRGGATSWENCVLADRRVNRRKGARTPDEAGLRLLRRPVAPRAQPSSVWLRNTHGIPEWDLFLAHAASPDAA